MPLTLLLCFPTHLAPRPCAAAQAKDDPSAKTASAQMSNFRRRLDELDREVYQDVHGEANANHCGYPSQVTKHMFPQHVIQLLLLTTRVSALHDLLNTLS